MLRHLVLILSLLIFLYVGLVNGQDDESEPLEEIDLLCDAADLIDTVNELQTLLLDFETQVDTNNAEALNRLYETGQQYQELALSCGFIPDDIDSLMVGTDVERILVVLEEMSGDPLQGQLLYNNEENAADGNLLGCTGCHSEEITAPPTEGTWTRWDEIRSKEPQFEGYTFEHYVVESIIHPWDYLVPDYGEVMPTNFGDRLSYQDLADLIAYLNSQDQFLD